MLRLFPGSQFLLHPTGNLFGKANSFNSILLGVSLVRHGKACQGVRISGGNIIAIQKFCHLDEPVTKTFLRLFDNNYIYIALLEVASCTELSAASQEVYDGWIGRLKI